MNAGAMFDIDGLISCPKVVVDPPKDKLYPKGAYWRNDMTLKSEDGAHLFRVYMRKNMRFEENYSIGLMYSAPGHKGEIRLFACNGPHGPHINFPHHTTPHVHQADPVKLAAGLRGDREAEPTDQYFSFDEALVYFFKRCKIKDAGHYIDMHIQRQLFD